MFQCHRAAIHTRSSQLRRERLSLGLYGPCRRGCCPCHTERQIIEACWSNGVSSLTNGRGNCSVGVTEERSDDGRGILLHYENKVRPRWKIGGSVKCIDMLSHRSGEPRSSSALSESKILDLLQEYRLYCSRAKTIGSSIDPRRQHMRKPRCIFVRYVIRREMRRVVELGRALRAAATERVAQIDHHWPLGSGIFSLRGALDMLDKLFQSCSFIQPVTHPQPLDSSI